MPAWAISHGPDQRPLVQPREAITAVRHALAYVCTAPDWRRLAPVIGPPTGAAAVTPDEARRVAGVLHRFANSRLTPAPYGAVAVDLAACARRAAEQSETWTWREHTGRPRGA